VREHICDIAALVTAGVENGVCRAQPLFAQRAACSCRSQQKSPHDAANIMLLVRLLVALHRVLAPSCSSAPCSSAHHCCKQQCRNSRPGSSNALPQHSPGYGWRCPNGELIFPNLGGCSEPNMIIQARYPDKVDATRNGSVQSLAITKVTEDGTASE